MKEKDLIGKADNNRGSKNVTSGVKEAVGAANGGASPSGLVSLRIIRHKANLRLSSC